MTAHATDRLVKNQKGFASIVIALILIILLALLTVGFAQLSRREQQTALANQLASQATDAAESGINDAYSDIQNKYITANGPATATTVPADNTNCMKPTPTNLKTHNQTIDASSEISYTCLLVDLQPPNIQFGGLAPGTDRYVSFTTDVSATSFTINWSSDDGATGYPGSGSIPASGTQFTPYDAWTNSTTTPPKGNAPLLQLTITPLGGTFTRGSLINNSFTAYLYPTSGGINSVAYVSGIGTSNGGANPDAPLVSGKCGSGSVNGYPCSVTVTGFSGTGPYLIRLLDYYDTARVLITGTPTVGSTPVSFIDGQAQVDVTGQAKNVLKRLQVRLPLSASLNLPPYAVEGQSICKRLHTDPVTGTTYADLPGGNAVSQAACGFGGTITKGSAGG